MKAIRCSIYLFLLFALPQILPAATIAVTPSSQSVNLGDQTVVSLDISGLGSGVAPSVGAFDIDLSFDSSVLALASVVFGDPVLGDQLDLSGLGSIFSSSPGVGTVNLFELSLDSAADLDLFQAEAFTIATLTFDTLAAGSSSLGLSINALGDAEGLPLDAILNSGTVSVVEPPVNVPEPSPWATYLGGLAVLALLWRRRRSLSA